MPLKAAALTQVLLVLFAWPAFAQFTLVNQTLSSGGGPSTGGPYTLHGSAGQHDAGPQATTTGSRLKLLSGYWNQAEGIALSGYQAWAAINIPADLDAAFDADANLDGLPNGLAYALGASGFQVFDRGLLSRPPAQIPTDVNLFLETSTDGRSWDPLLQFDAGQLAFQAPTAMLSARSLIHRTDDPVRLYRYRGELIP